MTEPVDSGWISLEMLVTLWPIAICLSTYLSVNDLVSVARSSSGLRAALHGFGLPSPLTADDGDGSVRQSIHVGFHGTPCWQRLKNSSAKICSSKTHKKGDKVHHCRLCNTLICEACIVRASFAARGKEDTFKNRCRFFCQDCWDDENTGKTYRYPLHPWLQTASDGLKDGTDDQRRLFCTCTLKDDGWLCLECKERQNYEAQSNDRFRCHGLGCSNLVGPDFEGRRICIWCNQTLPRHIGSSSRAAWNQKIIEARTRNAQSRQADMAEYNRKRLQMMRMSRREMRGDEAVQRDPDADAAQFVRHLDSCCNYRNFMREEYAPDGNAVYASKKGYWRYSLHFLLEIGKRCARSKQQRRNHRVTSITSEGSSIFSRTIRQLRQEQEYYRNKQSTNVTTIRGEKFNPPLSNQRITEWVALKTHILDLAFVQQLPLCELQIALQIEHDFELRWSEFRSLLNVWSLTPLWEGTETDAGELFSSEGTAAQERRSTQLQPRDRRLRNRQETRFDNVAASIIELLIHQGRSLPLRSALDSAQHLAAAPPSAGAILEPQRFNDMNGDGLPTHPSSSSSSCRFSKPLLPEPDHYDARECNRAAHLSATTTLLSAYSDRQRDNALTSTPPPPLAISLDGAAHLYAASDWSTPIRPTASATEGRQDQNKIFEELDDDDDDDDERASLMSDDSLENALNAT